MLAYVLLTERCNLTCAHCIRGCGSRLEMPLHYAFDVIDQIIDFNAHASIVLSGGEPTLYRRFECVLEHALERVADTVIVNSNGTTNICEIFKRRKDLGKARVQLSVDGDARSHDKIRGHGSFQKVFNSLRELATNGLRPWVSTVVTPDNLVSMDRLRDLLVKLDIEKWHISPILPFGNGSERSMLPVEAWNGFVDHMIDTTPIRLSIKKLFDTSLLSRLETTARTELEHKMSTLRMRNCGCGNAKLYFYPDCNVYGCACLTKYPFGNLMRGRLVEIMKSPNAVSICNYTLSDDSPCKSCDFVRLCNGGCIGMSLHHFGRIGVGDPRCPLFQGLVEGRRQSS